MRGCPKFLIRKRIKWFAAGCEFSDNGMRLAEGDTFAYEILDQIGRQQLRIIRQ